MTIDCDDSTFLEARITRTEELIVIYEDAIAALGAGAQSYQLSTGQTTQLVTKANLATMRTTLSSLENRRATLRATLLGGTHVTPAW
jgi:hypothetical protein